MFCALNFTNAVFASAMTIEGTIHIPFGRRVEEAEFFTSRNWLNGYQFHQGGVEETVWSATVINAL